LIQAVCAQWVDSQSGCAFLSLKFHLMKKSWPMLFSFK
jgi:hypothetical protein